MVDSDSQNSGEKNAPPKNAAAAATGDFPVWQTHLLQKTGLPEKDFRRLRNQHCIRDVDWRVGKLNHIEFTEAGAAKMLRIATEATEKTPPAALPVAAPRAPDVPRPVRTATNQLTSGAPLLAQADVKLTVRKIWPNNRGRLQGCVVMDGRHKKGELVVVRVRDNSRFRAGQAITGRHVEGNVYQVSGRVR